MSVRLGKYSFKGPFESVKKIKDRSGVYAIVCKSNGEYFVIEIGESSTVKRRINDHDKKECWEKHCDGQILLFVYYTRFLKQNARKYIEQELVELFSPSCKLEVCDQF